MSSAPTPSEGRGARHPAGAPTLAPPRSSAGPPRIDGDGLLRYDDRWVAVPERQVPVVELFLRNPDRLVTSAQVAEVYGRTGASTSAASLKTLVHRVGRRLGSVGLVLRTVRGRGAMLEAAQRSSSNSASSSSP